MAGADKTGDTVRMVYNPSQKNLPSDSWLHLPLTVIAGKAKCLPWLYLCPLAHSAPCPRPNNPGTKSTCVVCRSVVFALNCTLNPAQSHAQQYKVESRLTITSQRTQYSPSAFDPSPWRIIAWSYRLSRAQILANTQSHAGRQQLLWGLNLRPSSVSADACCTWPLSLSYKVDTKTFHQVGRCVVCYFSSKADWLRYNVALAALTLWSPSLTRRLIGHSETEKPFWDASDRPLFKISAALQKRIAKRQPKQQQGVISHFCKEDLVTNMWTRSSASNDNHLQSCEVGRGQTAVIPCPHDGMCQADTHAGDTWPTCILAAHVDAREGNVSGC